MGPFQRWFRRVSRDASIVIGHSRVRLEAIDTVMFVTRTDDPTIEALVFFRAPHPDMGRICVKYRGSEAENVRRLLRGLERY